MVLVLTAFDFNPRVYFLFNIKKISIFLPTTSEVFSGSQIFDFYRYSQGLTSDTWNIKYPHFSEVKVKIPTNKEEQSKIVEVLKKSEEEINLLKNELEELKLQKKALMQKLLTGQVRVKI